MSGQRRTCRDKHSPQTIVSAFCKTIASAAMRLSYALGNLRTIQTMGWYLWEDDPTTCGRFCRECGYFQVWGNFYADPKGRNGKHSICKLCLNTNRAWCARYRREHQAPQSCQGCGREGPVEVDHCHDSMQFRAWLCRTCNRHNRRWERVHGSL